MKKEFRPGNIVKLKSGSQNMTVVKYDMLPGKRNNTPLPNLEPEVPALVSVTWQDAGRLKIGKFDPALLMLAE